VNICSTFGHNTKEAFHLAECSRKIWLALALLIAACPDMRCRFICKRGVESIARKEFDFACGEIRTEFRPGSHMPNYQKWTGFFEAAERDKREAWSIS